MTTKRNKKGSESPQNCVLCGKEIYAYGHSAQPLAKGICCDFCNTYKVIPARLAKAKEGISQRYMGGKNSKK